MTNFNEFTKAFGDLPNALPFDEKSLQDGFKTWASFNERMAGIVLDSAKASTEIAASSAKDTISNMRGLTAYREQPADYANAVTEFTQAQFKIAQDATAAFTGLAQQSGSDVAELASKTGETAQTTAKTAASKTKAA